jgi:NAD(P)-dependent dehydrogenase (short-subunit alcohol dehydrogenase family)
VSGSLDGKVAIVTGAAQGIGNAIARGLAAEGARIVVADLSRAEEAAAAFDDGVGVTVDVSDEEQVARMVDETSERCGRVDILVNNAGLYASLPMRPFTEIPVDEWRQVMDVNVLSMFLTCRAVVPKMREHGGGRIVNLASIVGRAGAVDVTSHYAAAKAAVLGLTRALAREMGPRGVTCNAVAPGLIVTSERIRENQALMEAVVPHVLLGRLGESEDVADLICFLASRESVYITGQVYAVDGGYLAHLPAPG